MREPRHAYCVAVVGSPEVMTGEDLERLIGYLVNRFLDTHDVCLVSPGGARSPELRWCQDRGWTLILEPENRNRARQDLSIAAIADALVVLGDPAPWQRLIRLCREARTPTRVYRERPRLPAPRDYPPEG